MSKENEIIIPKSDERDEIYRQIDQDIDELTDDQKDFATWILLQRLIETYQAEYEKVDDKEFKDALYKSHLKKSVDTLNDAREFLAYKLW